MGDLRANCKDGLIIVIVILYLGTYHATDSSGIFYLGGGALLFDCLVGMLKPEAFSWLLLLIGLFTFGMGTLGLLAL